jgi:hypothetical protein
LNAEQFQAKVARSDMIYYEDKSFPANYSSLGMSEAQIKDVKWLRIGTLLKTEKL